jgi:hypothetical protein
MSHTLHKKRYNHIILINYLRSLRSSKHLSEMDILNAEYNFIKAKKANVKIVSDRKC